MGSGGEIFFGARGPNFAGDEGKHFFVSAGGAALCSPADGMSWKAACRQPSGGLKGRRGRREARSAREERKAFRGGRETRSAFLYGGGKELRS